MRRADAMWRSALGAHANKLRALRNRIDGELTDITVKRPTVAVNVVGSDPDHLKVVISELEEAGWAVQSKMGELLISVPESIRNPPQAAQLERVGDIEDGA